MKTGWILDPLELALDWERLLDPLPELALDWERLLDPLPEPELALDWERLLDLRDLELDDVELDWGSEVESSGNKLFK